MMMHVFLALLLCHGGVAFSEPQETVDLVEHNTTTWVKHIAGRPPQVRTVEQIILWRWNPKEGRHTVANCRAGDKFKHTEINVAGKQIIIGVFDWCYDPDSNEIFNQHRNVKLNFKYYRRTFSVNYDPEKDDLKHTKRWKRKPYY